MSVWCLVVGLLAILVSSTEANIGPVPKELQKINKCMLINDGSGGFESIDVHSKEVQEVLGEGVVYLNGVMQKTYICLYHGIATRALRQSIPGGNTYCVRFWAFDGICADPSLASLCNTTRFPPSPMLCDLLRVKGFFKGEKPSLQLHCAYPPPV